MTDTTQTSLTRGLTGLEPVEIDTLKGILIVLIVIGHNVLLSTLFPEFRSQIYNFHVAGFMLLPFLFRSRKLSARLVADRAVRYLVPFAAFYTLSALLYAAVISPPDSLTSWSVDYFRGLLLGSDRAVKSGSGLALFWFLPAIFTLSLIRAAATSGKWIRLSLLAACLVIHLSAGAAPEWAKFYIPFGLLVVGFVFPLGALLEALWTRHIGTNILRAGIIGTLVLTVCIYLSVILNTGINLGKVRLYAWENIALVILHDALILSAFVVAAWISVPLSRIKLLAVFGRYSLVIYLSHSLIYQLIVLVSRKADIAVDNWPAAIAVLITTLFLALASALIIHRTALLRVWLTPRDAAQWPLTCAAAR